MVVAHKHRISVGLGNTYKNGTRCVRIRVTYAGGRTDLHTKLSAEEKQWDSKKQRFKQSGKSQTDEFFFVFDKYIETRSETRRWSKEYREMFARTRQSLKTFKADIRFTDFSTETMNKYLSHLSKTMYNDKIA